MAGGILNRDALSKLITENKIDISSTIATPIHQDAKLRRETQKSSKVCLRSFNIDVSATVPWFLHKAENYSGQSIWDSIPGGKGANQSFLTWQQCRRCGAFYF